MTQRTDAAATSDADALLEQLRELQTVHVFNKGEAALRFAASTVAALRRLEARITQLEAIIDGD